MGEPPNDPDIAPFREYALTRNADAFWDYVNEYEDDEGTVWGGFWQAVLFREEVIEGIVHAWFITLSDEELRRAWLPHWKLSLDLLDAAWERHLEEYAQDHDHSD